MTRTPTRNSYIRPIFVLLLILNGVQEAKSQSDGSWLANAEYGSLTELAGKTKVFIATDNLQTRSIVAEELVKCACLQVSSRREDADFMLLYGSETGTTGASIGLFNNVTRDTTTIGQLLALVVVGAPDSNERRVRVLWSTQKSRNYSSGITLDKNPARSSIQAFIKAFMSVANADPSTQVENLELIAPYVNRAIESANKKKYKEAIADLKVAIVQSPKTAVLHGMMATALIELRNFTEAELSARKAVVLEPKNGTWHAILGESLDNQKKTTEAEIAYRTGFELAPEEPRVLNDYGYFLAVQGKDLETAVALLLKAHAAEPHNSYTLDSLGWAYFKSGRYDEAEKYLKLAIDEKEGPREIPLEHLGDLYQKQGKAEKAQSAWKKALSITVDPEMKLRLNGKIGKD
jgi:Flp pilus assembly protein TadD